MGVYMLFADHEFRDNYGLIGAQDQELRFLVLMDRLNGPERGVIWPSV